VLRVFPQGIPGGGGRGVNIVKKTTKRATNPNDESGIIELTAPIAASKVMLLDPKSGEAHAGCGRRADKDGTVQRIAGEIRPADSAREKRNSPWRTR